MRTINPAPWTCRGVDVWPASGNSSGVRWYARVPDPARAGMRADCPPTLRADSKQSMRALVREYRTGAR